MLIFKLSVPSVAHFSDCISEAVGGKAVRHFSPQKSNLAHLI